MNKRHLILLLALLGSAAFAQQQTDEQEPEIRRYTVEMIIFSYAQDVATGTEVFIPELPAEIDMLALDSRDVPRDKRTVVDRRPYELVMLAATDFTLNEVYAHLRRLDVYKPLMHFGWTQGPLPREDSVARPLASFATPPAGLDGELTLYLGRYLHLAVNLQLDAAGAKPFANNTFEDAAQQPVRYQIDENRIIRNGELRYFDHPKFGVLARVTRVEETQENDEFLGDLD